MIAPTAISVTLLGQPDVRRDGAPVSLPSRNTLLLLARIAVEGRQSRDVLATLLWPEADTARGRTNLRRTIAYLRDACGRDVETLQQISGAIALTDAVTADVQVVRRALERPLAATDLRDAIALWNGDFLEGVTADGEELDGWLRRQRESWHQRLSLASERLVASLTEAGDAAGAWTVSDIWISRDPLSEAAHRERVRLHLIRGDPAAALEAYRASAELLRRELGVRPSPELEQLAALARAGTPLVAASGQQPAADVPMVGRGAQHAMLTRALTRVQTGEPMHVLVTGEAGIGKTRLVDEFSAWAGAHGADVRRSRAFPSAHRIAYEALGGAFADALPRAPRTPVQTRSQREIVSATWSHLRRLSAHAPLVVLVEDLQWLDPDSLELLVQLATLMGRERARVLLVTTARDDEMSGNTALRDWLARVVTELPFIEIALPPLSSHEVDELARAWPRRVDAGAAEALRAASGRPLLVVETLRYLAEGGDPETLAPAAREALQARLRALSEPERAIAGAAAIMERESDLATLSAVAELPALPARRALDELLRRHVLVGSGTYMFCHELLRRAAYTMIAAEQRRSMHAIAAGAVDAAGDAASEVARHAELSGLADLAWERRLQAAKEASDVAAFRVAADQLRAAIALRPDVSSTWLDLGRAEELSGNADLASATYERLVQRARRSGRVDDEAAALVRLAELAGRRLSSPPPVELFEEAADAAREAADAALQAEAALAAAQVDAYRGLLKRAESTVDAVSDALQSAGSDELRARCLNLGAFIQQAQGRWRRALDLSREAQRAYRLLGDAVMEVDSAGYELASLVFLGRWRDALRRARRVMARAESLDNPWAVSNIALTEAWGLRDGGRLEEARETADRGARAAQAADFAPLQVLNTLLAGRCCRELGNVSRALQTHNALIDLTAHMDGVAYQAVAEELCADHAAAGDWMSAAHWARESIARWGEMTMFTWLSLWLVAEAVLRDGGAFALPALPDTPRYDLVRLRTEAIVARHHGDNSRSVRLLREALNVAEQLELGPEAAELREIQPPVSRR